MDGFLAPGLTSAFSAAGKLLLSSVSLESQQKTSLKQTQERHELCSTRHKTKVEKLFQFWIGSRVGLKPGYSLACFAVAVPQKSLLLQRQDNSDQCVCVCVCSQLTWTC